MKGFVFSAWGLTTAQTCCCGTFSWDKPTRSGAGNMGCTQGPSFGLETSIMACHSSSSTIVWQGAIQLLLHTAGLAYSIFPQNRGFGASCSWINPKGNIQNSLTSQGMASRVATQGAISITEAALLHREMHFGPLRDRAEDGEVRSHLQHTPCTLEQFFNIFVEPSPCTFYALAQETG